MKILHLSTRPVEVAAAPAEPLADDAPATLPPSQLDSDLDNEMFSYIHHRANARDRVLIIDDDCDILRALEDVLSDEKLPDGTPAYEITTARGGRAGVQEIVGDEPDPDVILLDWMMPEVGGDAIHDFLKRSPRYTNIPILVITAQAHAFRDIGAQNSDHIYLSNPTRASKLAARKAARTGGTSAPPPLTEVLPKPIDVDTLLTTIKRAIDTKKGRT